MKKKEKIFFKINLIILLVLLGIADLIIEGFKIGLIMDFIFIGILAVYGKLFGHLNNKPNDI